MFKLYRLKNFHFQLIIYLSLLTIIGIMVIGSASPSDQKKQIFGFVLGLVVMLVISVIDYRYFVRFGWIYYLFSFVMLLLVKVAGKVVGGSRRWLVIPGINFQFQPSEFVKILLILFFAYFFMKYQEKINTVKILPLSLVLIAIPLAFILMQPDLSTSIVVAFIFVTLLFIAGLSYKIILTVLGIVIPIIVIGISYMSTHTEQLAEIYQFRRIMAWRYPNDSRWAELALQQQNSIMAIGSGQLWGKGLNNSVATSMNNSNFIIEPQTDFIFAVLGEELGFAGSLTIIILLILIIFECINIARTAKDLSGRLICCGMAALIGFQSFVNISVASGIMPNTGIPLPFVSYGLTSLVSLFAGMGFVLNIGLQPKK